MSAEQNGSKGGSPSHERLGSAKLRGKLSAQVFINGIERRQRLKLQHDMFDLCDENRALGGKHWRTVLKRFGLKESEVWPNTVISTNDNKPNEVTK